MQSKNLIGLFNCPITEYCLSDSMRYKSRLGKNRDLNEAIRFEEIVIFIIRFAIALFGIYRGSQPIRLQ